jgi:hypothetical protein
MLQNMSYLQHSMEVLVRKFHTTHQQLQELLSLQGFRQDPGESVG